MIMKRSWLKRKTKLRRTKSCGTRRVGRRETVSSAKKKAWKAFSEYIRLRDAINTTGTFTHANCITCGRIHPVCGFGCLQAGHFIPGRGNAILFEETNCHGQCPKCNIFMGGNAIEYFVQMEKRYGREEIERLRALSHQIRPWSPQELLEIRDIYQAKIKEMKSRDVNHAIDCAVLINARHDCNCGAE